VTGGRLDPLFNEAWLDAPPVPLLEDPKTWSRRCPPSAMSLPRARFAAWCGYGRRRG